MIIGTAGHIDHGKTTLVKALTGVDCDRLPEEKARGITLDLGYAYTPLPDGSVLGFIDVPGHEKLVHTMLAGATGIDFALLVVAADDGVMPQTREHLELLQLLGVSRGAVAVTKCDVVADLRLAEVAREVQALLADGPLAAAPLFPVSAISGEGIAELRAYLDGVALSLPRRASQGGFRLAIDRVFTLPGVGTVVTGTAHAGHVSVGDQLTVVPSGKHVRVKSLRVQDRPAESGSAGERIALALAGVDKQELSRGMWLVAPSLALALSRCHGEVLVTKDKPLKHLQVVHVHLGTADVTGRVALLDCENEAPTGKLTLIELLLDAPVHALVGDRFILRDASAQRTVAGGRILDIFPPTRHKRSAAHLGWLELLRANDPALALAEAAKNSPTGVDLTRFAQAWNLPAEEMAGLERKQRLRIIVAGEARHGFAEEGWERLAQKLIDTLRLEHERSPDLVGLTRERLRRICAQTLPEAAFATLVEELRAQGKIEQTQSFLHLPEHRPQLSTADRDLFQTLLPLLAAVPLNPPRVRDVARASGVPEERVRQLLRRFARAGELYPVAHDHYFTATAVARLAEIVRELCEEKGAARAADFRDRIFADGKGGRKVAIQILEFFDRIGYTRRVREEHRLRSREK